MTVAAAKEKLHDIIDHADENKVFELLLLIEDSNADKDYVYTEDTLRLLRERSEEYRSEKVQTYTLEESLERIKKHRENTHSFTNFPE